MCLAKQPALACKLPCLSGPLLASSWFSCDSAARSPAVSLQEKQMPHMQPSGRCAQIRACSSNVCLVRCASEASLRHEAFGAASERRSDIWRAG